MINSIALFGLYLLAMFFYSLEYLYNSVILKYKDSLSYKNARVLESNVTRALWLARLFLWVSLILTIWDYYQNMGL